MDGGLVSTKLICWKHVSLLLQAGKKEEALQSLDEGVRHDYFNMPELIPFYSLTAKLRREVGRVDEARILEDRVREMEKMTTAGYYLRGY